MRNFIKTFCFVMLLWLNPYSVQGQQNSPVSPGVAPPNPFQILLKVRNENNYLAPLIELKRREAEYMAFPPMREV